MSYRWWCCRPLQQTWEAALRLLEIHRTCICIAVWGSSGRFPFPDASIHPCDRNIAGLAVLFQKKEKVEYSPQKSNAVWGKKRKFYFVSYVVMFLCCLAGVSKILPPMALFFLVLVFLLVADRKILCCIDYALLGTFVAFFIFIGNLGRVPAFRDFFAGILTGHETLAGVVSSRLSAMFRRHYFYLALRINGKFWSSEPIWAVLEL